MYERCLEDGSLLSATFFPRFFDIFFPANINGCKQSLELSGRVRFLAMELISTVLSAIKEAGPKMYTAAFFGSLALVLAPPHYLAALGLTDFKREYGMAIGATLLVSGSLLLAHLLFALTRPFKRFSAERRFNASIKQTLRELTDEEKEFLRGYIRDGENTLYASIYDGVANGLVAKNITYRASNLSVPGSPGLKFPFNLQPYARKFLGRTPELLD
jgi:hypothetical protein